jgi:O-methyltransferase
MPRELTPIKVAVRSASRKLAGITRARRPMLFPTYSDDVRKRIEQYHDDVRYSTLALALQRIQIDQIGGSFAEVGVYQGATSLFIHKQCPDRTLFLFDTFEGFQSQDMENGRDDRFKDTSVAAVKKLLGDTPTLRFRQGHFPETSIGLEGEKFSFVMLDVDMYQPSLEVFRFFYPRLTRGGYFFMHDYNSAESERAVSRAAHTYMSDKPELLVEIPDYFGTALFRKI